MNADLIDKYQNIQDEGIIAGIKPNFDNVGENQMQSNSNTKRRREIAVKKTKVKPHSASETSIKHKFSLFNREKGIG